MIKTFRCRDTERVFNFELVRKWEPGLRKAALRKLKWLDAAADLNDLRVPPANRLEKLKGGREGQHSIRVNDQYRLCFVWRNGHAHDVELVDYH